ncbi:MAG: NADH-quinone oxidoreductase subunit G [Proteobacteria bacterium]|nr:NADH-quinone oxidoreductase subunit G [Pseudomonadota bacterium]
MVDLEIDNKPVSVEPGATIIEAADQIGVYIPRFCYHKKLSIAANCRMCLVEVEKTGKALPACATPVTQGMKVHTISQKAIDAQKAVMEFLLINHPLDCPICDQGGECELQDLSMGFGSSHSHYNQPKRSVFNDDLGPLIATEMTRCIQCTRCVRFGDEIAGMRELGVTYRGESEQITTYVKHMMQSEVSANIIDLCPVGALLNKPAQFSLRAWEVKEHPSIAVHDCLGTNIFFHSRGEEFTPQRQILRVVPRENSDINETWISDRDRFSYWSLKHPDRLLKPQIKRNGQWHEIDWEPLLMEIAHRTQVICHEQGADQVAGLVSPNSTLEECYLFQKWMRAFGSNNIDHRFRQQDFSDQGLAPAYPNIGMALPEIESLQTVLLVGSHIRYEQPLLGLRLYQAFQDGAQVMAINPMDYHFTFPLSQKIITADLIHGLTEIAAVLSSAPAFKEITPSPQAQAIASRLQETGSKSAIWIGEYALGHPEAAKIRALVGLICQAAQARAGILPDGVNTPGAWLMGAVPHRGPGRAPISNPGANALSLLTDQRKRAYFLLGLEPELDCLASAAAVAGLQKADLVVCLTSFVTPEMKEYAHYLLPITPITENIGTFVNISGLVQQFLPISVPLGDSKQAWKIFRVLANLMNLEGFEYENIHEVQAELQKYIDPLPGYEPFAHSIANVSPKRHSGLTRLAPWLMYRSDPMVRRSLPLQQTMSQHLTHIAIHSSLAKELNLQPGDRVTARQENSEVTLPVHINDRLAPEMVFIPSALAETIGFGRAFAPVTLHKEEAIHG